MLFAPRGILAAVALIGIPGAQTALAAAGWVKSDAGKVNADKVLETGAAPNQVCAGPDSTFSIKEVSGSEATVVFKAVVDLAKKCTTAPAKPSIDYKVQIADLAANATNQNQGQSPSTSDFFKDWGVGLALIKNRTPAITDASIINNTVRVNAQSNWEATLLVARHFYPFQRPGKKCADGAAGGFLSADLYGDCLGAMVAVGLGNQSGSSATQVINFVGIGITIGSGSGTDSSAQWNLGGGYGRKFGVKTLGDGFTRDAAPPAGETQVRFKTIDTNAPFLFFTAHW